MNKPGIVGIVKSSAGIEMVSSGALTMLKSIFPFYLSFLFSW